MSEYLNTNIKTTDRLRWRLEVDHGKQTWHYLESNDEIKNWPQTACDRYWLGLSDKIVDGQSKHSPPKSALEAVYNGYKFFKQLQTVDGHWAGEYSGPTFLISGFVFSTYITRLSIPQAWKTEIITYLVYNSNPDDGGWGIHVEDHSNLLGTTLNYVALRILGMDPEHPILVKSRALIHKLGGAIAIPSLGKFWLAMLNLYDWNGVNPVLPELWLLPYKSPLHPARMRGPIRASHLSLSYLYGRKVTEKMNPLIERLRLELFIQPFDKIDWSAAKNNVCETDIYFPRSPALVVTNTVSNIWNKFQPILGLREIALKKIYKLMKLEEFDSNYISTCAMDKLFRLICAYHKEGPESEMFLNMKEKIANYIWMTPNGMLMNYTDGSQIWDTSLAIQAIIESGLANDPDNHESMIKALEFLDDSQIQSNPTYMKQCWREPSKGLWCFSTREQGWSANDCTAEALKAVLLLQGKLDYTQPLINQKRIQSTIDTLIRRQHSNGGYSRFEGIRGYCWMELINPSEIFENTFIEHTYVECTSSVMTALRVFSKFDLVDHYVDDIEIVCAKAAKYIHSMQRKDGSWLGSWGICFTYGTMSALQGLSSVGENYENSEYVKKACNFLISKQREDGGWGEDYKSASGVGQYIQHPNSQVVNTAWALLGLMYAGYPFSEPIINGIEFIKSRQLPSGEWKKESFKSIIGKNCPINHSNYEFIYSIWALGMYSNLYESDEYYGVWEII
ncbi:terpenoid cyclases/protein prenyltransferase alpha-alpha toroid [Gigaspora rosea]|uniref:Terpene cyclase/mutase family member n=1 Tax=Gigaspora rosea TaxID=44941 RepID=A0A397VM44_9GLOM|nr:terpenoid cyclases/protein prenyltransferase alpha-alpha toroid [Gigaspora rosea]